ncbi:hypothetical protein GY45DRAFT_1127663 [Cubamyces sp. BRFM 1775]|nr:hypothetical protein GY45DRAFT_1127663 [Cubamyces sp. BRFM 1775]
MNGIARARDCASRRRERRVWRQDSTWAATTEGRLTSLTEERKWGEKASTSNSWRISRRIRTQVIYPFVPRVAQAMVNFPQSFATPLWRIEGGDWYKQAWARRREQTRRASSASRLTGFSPLRAVPPQYRLKSPPLLEKDSQNEKLPTGRPWIS